MSSPISINNSNFKHYSIIFTTNQTFIIDESRNMRWAACVTRMGQARTYKILAEMLK
jgi:hypothetical protein